jgi:hypothetical protein
MSSRTRGELPAEFLLATGNDGLSCSWMLLVARTCQIIIESNEMLAPAYVDVEVRFSHPIPILSHIMGIEKLHELAQRIHRPSSGNLVSKIEDSPHCRSSRARPQEIPSSRKQVCHSGV